MDLPVTPPDHHLTLTIVAIKAEAPDVKTFFLASVNGESIPYDAGQFLTFIFNRPGRGEERRSYSVSSSPAKGEPLAITVKRVENGAHSRWLIDHAKVGDQLECAGAAGLFVLPPDIRSFPQIFFFAAGIGITPIYSMIKEVLQLQLPNELVLFYSNRDQESATFRVELQELQRQYPQQLQIEWLYSNAKNLLRARLTKAILPQLFQQYLKISAANILTYICGPEDYRWMLTLLLDEAGVPSSHIRKEIFLPGRMPIASLPPDTAAHDVTIALKGQKSVLNVQYPETILSAARKAGISMPYSCGAGRCASCIVKCTSGKVWMAYNEVLTAQDLENGLVLTCTGYPVGGAVTLEVS